MSETPDFENIDLSITQFNKECNKQKEIYFWFLN